VVRCMSSIEVEVIRADGMSIAVGQDS
jgi:hypothetical protein